MFFLVPCWKGQTLRVLTKSSFRPISSLSHWRRSDSATKTWAAGMAAAEYDQRSVVPNKIHYIQNINETKHDFKVK